MMNAPRLSPSPATAAVLSALLPAALAAAGGLPDLAIESVDAGGLSGGATALLFDGVVEVVVANIGDAPAGASSLLLFEDAVGSPANTPGVYDPGVDLLLGTADVPALAAGDSTIVPVALVAAPLLFRDSVLFAVADATGRVAESDESNNVGSTADDCFGSGTLPSFEPVLAWHWNPLAPGYAGDPAFAAWANVMVTPAIADVTGPQGVPDGIPDVIFPSTDDTGGGTDFRGVLRVVDGQTGIEWYSVTAQPLWITAACSPAVGDIDGDGLPEIVCSAFPSLAVRIFEHDGTHKLDSVQTGVIGGWNAIALANIDPPGVDPLPEIIVRARVIDRDGTTRWSGAVGAGATTNGYGIAYAADVDADGAVEVVAGDRVYDAAGNLKLNLTGGDLFTAVGDFDDDPKAEFVLVGGGIVQLRDDDGSLIWQAGIPGGGYGGPPTIADFDNDGLPDVGVAGAVRYVVYRGTGPQGGSILWQRVTSDTSSNRTGSSVFDFEGDGFADVVYRDQNVLYLMDGATGADKTPPIPLSSCTWTEYVQVADVDADGHAEIVAVANNNCGFGPQRGVYAYENIDDDWVNTRRIWNQHAYSITNVADDLSVPETAPINWLFPAADPFNNFRQNLPATGIDALALPDLTASFLRIGACGPEGFDEVLVRVGNGGSAPADVVNLVAVFDANAGPGAGPLGSVVLAQSIASGGFLDLTVALDAPVPFGTALLAAVDAGSADRGDVSALLAGCADDPAAASPLPGSNVTECDECNNAILATLHAPACLADLNCDGVVDELDLALLLKAWGSRGPFADIKQNGVVDGGDLGQLLAVWGPCPSS